MPAGKSLYLELDSYGFDEGGDCTEGFDNKAVAVTTNGGESFSILNDCYDLHPGIAGESGEEDSLDFRTLRFDLSDYAGQEVQLGFLYDTEDDCCDTELGWFIDNLVIGEGLVMKPIGSDSSPFTGNFNGDGHSISNLAISGAEDAGLFGYTGETSKIRNLNLIGGEVDSADDTAGGLVGYNEGLIVNVHSTVTVLGYGATGGLVGENEGEIRSSSADAEVESYQDGGGLVGENYGLIKQSFAEGLVNGLGNESSSLGGLVGENGTEGTIEDSYSTATVEGLNRIGGLVGDNDGLIMRSYSSGSVSGFDNVGGLAGYSSGSINLSFSAADINPYGEAAGLGGLIGENEDGTITASYYDMERTLTFCTMDGADPDPEGCIGVNGENSQPNYFKGNKTNPPLDQWNFDNIWLTQTSNYPVLRGYSYEDLNGDGVPDDEQPHVSGYTSPITGKIVVIDVGEGCELNVDDIMRESDLDAQDPGYDYENGLFDFEAECEEGSTASIKLFYYGVSAEDLVLRKHNPNTNAYFTITHYALSETTINDQDVLVAQYDIVDGGELDMDGTVNGQIVDPVGLASNVVGAPNTGLGGRAN